DAQTAAETALVALSLATAFGFCRLFTGWSWFPTLALAAVASHLLAILCRRRGLGLLLSSLISLPPLAPFLPLPLSPPSPPSALPPPLQRFPTAAPGGLGPDAQRPGRRLARVRHRHRPRRAPHRFRGRRRRRPLAVGVPRRRLRVPSRRRAGDARRPRDSLHLL